MDFFTRGYNAFLSDKGQPQSADETIEKLADCVQHATLLEDRRAGVLSLKGLARDWTEKVGEKGLPGLIKVLHEDYKDTDTTKAVLETITILCTQSDKPQKSSYALNFTDQFIKDAKNVTVLLDILEEFDFYVRFNTVKLLVTLLYNRSDRIQECILTSPIGITRLIELLDDKREIIRNEGLLLLISLTETNADIQKIVAFGNTFERLLAIIEEEEGISGGIIVQDSLSLTHNLLRYNVSNQNYFRETSCIQQIPGLLGYVGDSNAEHVPYSYEDWPPQKVANTILVLQLIRILTEPAGVNTAVNQKVMTQSGILLPVVQLALCSNSPARVRTEALYAIAYLVCANGANQTAFIKTIVANQPNFAHNENGSATANVPRPALVALISIAVASDTQNSYALSSRAAAAYAATCCIDDNPDTQLVLAGTLQRVPEDNVNSQFLDKPHSAGSLILETLEHGAAAEKEPYAVWFACVIMSHIISGNDKSKELAAKVTFGEEAEGEEPVPLLHQIMAALMSSSKEPSQSRAPFGYLCLLCVWLFESPSSVKQFLSESIHVQFLIEEMQKTNVDPVVQGLAAFLLGIAFEYNDDEESELSRETLRDILLNRVGADQFKNRLSRLRDSPAYINVSKILYISAEEDEAFNLNGSLPMLVLDYHFVELFKESYDSIQRAITRDPKTAKPKIFKSDNSHVASSSEIQSYKEIISKQDNEMKELKSQIANLQHQVQQLMSEKQAADDAKKEVEDKYLREQARFATLEKEQEDLLVCMGEQDLDIQKYRDRLKALGQEVTDNEEDDEEDE
ncbi:Vesicle-mediated ER to Golgi transport protein [Umbelopsis sp. WA50703]